MPASDTGAVEMALWSLLGARPVTMLAWERFGEGWVTDVVKQLKLKDDVLSALWRAARSGRSRFRDDVVFTWNGTTSGVRVPDADWIAADRQGITICDATSAAFAQGLHFPSLMLRPSARRRSQHRAWENPVLARTRPRWRHKW